MITEILLGVLFISSASIFWLIISKKIPELIAIPDHVITERLHEESAKFHLFVLHFKSFFREGHYKEVLARFFGKFLQRLHIVVMRFDNAIVALSRRLREGHQSSLTHPPLPSVFQETPRVEGGQEPDSERIFASSYITVRKKEESISKENSFIPAPQPVFQYPAAVSKRNYAVPLRMSNDTSRARKKSVSVEVREDAFAYRRTITPRIITETKITYEPQETSETEQKELVAVGGRSRRSKVVSPEARE